MPNGSCRGRDGRLVTMDTHSRRGEIALLCGLLLADAAFYFVAIPHGIEDPEGFGLDRGLPPSFSARAAAILMALIMGVRLLWVLAGGEIAAPDEEPWNGEAATGSWRRNAAGIGIAFVFAVVLVPLAGYYLGAACMILALTAAMGERRRLHLVGQPVAVVGLIWLLFDRIFSIRLPAGILFDG